MDAEYTEIEDGEMLEEGDEYYSLFSGQWRVTTRVGQEVTTRETYRRKVTPAGHGEMQKICDSFNERHSTEYAVEGFALEKLESVKCYRDGWEDALKHDAQDVSENSQVTLRMSMDLFNVCRGICRELAEINDEDRTDWRDLCKAFGVKAEGGSK